MLRNTTFHADVERKVCGKISIYVYRFNVQLGTWLNHSFNEPFQFFLCTYMQTQITKIFTYWGKPRANPYYKTQPAASSFSDFQHDRQSPHRPHQPYYSQRLRRPSSWTEKKFIEKSHPLAKTFNRGFYYHWFKLPKQFGTFK